MPTPPRNSQHTLLDPMISVRSLASSLTGDVTLGGSSTRVGYLKVNRGSAQTVPNLTEGLEVEQVYVRSSHQGRGLGGRLLDLADETARAHRLGYVWLGVWEHNTKAISLHHR